MLPRNRGRERKPRPKRTPNHPSGCIFCTEPHKSKNSQRMTPKTGDNPAVVFEVPSRSPSASAGSASGPRCDANASDIDDDRARGRISYSESLAGPGSLATGDACRRPHRRPSSSPSRTSACKTKPALVQLIQDTATNDNDDDGDNGTDDDRD